jgi:hypothetical protein
MSQIEELSYAVDAVEIILDKISQQTTFVKMLKQLAEACEVDLMRSDCIFDGPLLFGGDFKEWLHHSFSSVFRVDLNRDNDNAEPNIKWCVSLRQMRFKLSKKMCNELLIDDLTQWKEVLSPTRDKDYPLSLSIIPVVNLMTGNFTVKTL